MNPLIAEDAFNMLAGKKIGGGIHRDVFDCKIRPDLVVKVEYETDYREFINVREMNFWCKYQDNKAIAQWLAPCEFMSPDGRILLQKRVEPVPRHMLPEKLPHFLSDIKQDNFGLIDGRLVCVDYGYVETSASTKLVKATW